MSAARGLMNSQSAMGRTNGAVKLKKVEDRHVQANIFSLSFFTVSTKPASLHGFLSASTKNNARFSVSGDWLGENRVPSQKEINWSGNVRQKMETQFNELTVLSDIRHPVSLGRDRWNLSHVCSLFPVLKYMLQLKRL